MTKHIRIALMTTLVFGLASLSVAAYAHTEGACKEDMKKFCADVKPGEGRLKECMKQHQSELSQACKDNMAEAKENFKEKREEVKEACNQDIQQFCANVTPGEGREMHCLKAYEDKLSAACKEKMPKHMGMMHQGMGHHGDKDDTHAEPPAVK